MPVAFTTPHGVPNLPISTEPAPGIISQMVWVTPDWMQAMLDRADASAFNNRPTSSDWVRILAEDMVSGRYEVTHQGMAFDPDWIILDGYHRGYGVIRSGIPQWIQISIFPTHEMAQNAMRVIDRHRKRQIGQTISMLGVVDGAGRAAVARCLLNFQHGRHQISDGVIYQLVEGTIESFTRVKEILRVESIGRLTATCLAALVYLEEVNPNALRAALDGIGSLANGAQQTLTSFLVRPPKRTSREETLARILWIVESLNRGRSETPRAFQTRTRTRILTEARQNLVSLWPDLMGVS